MATNSADELALSDAQSHELQSLPPAPKSPETPSSPNNKGHSSVLKKSKEDISPSEPTKPNKKKGVRFELEAKYKFFDGNGFVSEVKDGSYIMMPVQWVKKEENRPKSRAQRALHVVYELEGLNQGIGSGDLEEDIAEEINIVDLETLESLLDEMVTEQKKPILAG
ncbi:hypothetical protein B0O99DRAFT_673223 [Bisporella sp. PMI_857]|nr:hypothetical protein B0O99DRAFT_673223 [Bisporella sp. PMI_857]